MKKITIVLLGMFAIISLQAQSYYIDFTASGATNILDSVFVQNLTQGTSLTLGGSDTLHLIGTVDITDKTQSKDGIRIYPNPFTEKSYLEFYNENPTMIAIDIYDVAGKKILSSRQELESGLHIFEMSGLASGHYQLVVKADRWQKSAGFVSLQTGNQNPQLQFKNTLAMNQLVKTTSKGSKNTVQMSYNTGNQLRFVAFSGLMSEIVNDIPTSTKTIDFVLTAFTCGNNVTFNYGGNNITYGTVVSAGGRCWLDRNLGANQVATSSTDITSYGDLFQWGRAADGHQKRTSNTTTTLSSNDQTTHGIFIIAPSSPYDWRSPQNINLWQGVNGVNNPCPNGWRLPTETELNAERLSWGSNNAAGAFASPLRLTKTGNRYHFNGLFDYVGASGYYWTSTVNSTHSHYLHFDGISATMYSHYRAYGRAIRCIKD